MIAKWTHNGPCKKCGSKDNLGHWSDGSTFCWGCRALFRPPKTFEVAQKELQEIVEPQSESIGFKPKKKIELPADFTGSIPLRARDWLDQYGLSAEEWKMMNLGFSYVEDLLIWPFFDQDHNLRFWQGRYFGELSSHPKYISQGEKDFIHLYKGRNQDEIQKRALDRSIVIVEDIVSAMKVSRIVTASPLFGSNLSRQNAMRLSFLGYEYIYLWLDNDKQKEALKMEQEFKPIFRDFTVILSRDDPKQYTTAGIAEFLGC